MTIPNAHESLSNVPEADQSALALGGAAAGQNHSADELARVPVTEKMFSSVLSRFRKLAYFCRLQLTLGNLAHAATIAGSVVAAFALLFGYQQFKETSEMQREALRLERHTKLSDFHQRYVEISESRANPDATKEEKSAHRFVRAQKALSVLNGMYLASQDDTDWRQVIFWSLNNDPAISYAVQSQLVNCLVLSPGFLKMVRALSRVESSNICRDLTEAQ